MRRSAKKMFIRGFLQSFFIVVILLGAGVLSYQVTMHYWKPSQEDAVVAYKEQPLPEPITEASIDDISKNLIFCYNDETNEVNKIVLEIFNCERKQMNYITIPLRTQFTMSDTLYRKLVLVHPAIPQIMKLSSLTKYLDSNTVFDYGVLIVEDLLETKISYYTAIPQTTYDTMFTEAVEATDQSLPVETFTDQYCTFLQTLTSAEELSTYIEEIYPSFQSNLSLFDKMNYLESYCKTPLSNISFELVKGNDLNSAFVIDTELAAKRLEELTVANSKE